MKKLEVTFFQSSPSSLFVVPFLFVWLFVERKASNSICLFDVKGCVRSKQKNKLVSFLRKDTFSCCSVSAASKSSRNVFKNKRNKSRSPRSSILPRTKNKMNQSSTCNKTKKKKNKREGEVAAARTTTDIEKKK